MSEPILGKGPKGKYCIILDMPSPMSWARRGFLFAENLQIMNGVLKNAGIDPADIYYTYAVKVRMTDKVPPAILAHWRKILFEELNEVKPIKILAMGSIASAAISGDTRPSDVRNIRGRGFMTDLGNDKVYTVCTLPIYQVAAVPDNVRDLVQDVKKWAQNVEPKKAPILDLYIPDNQEELSKYLRLFGQADILSCDTETTGFNPLSEQLLCIGFATLPYKDLWHHPAGYSLVIPKTLIHEPETKEKLYAFFKGFMGTGKRLVFHNSKFDLKFLTMYFKGYDITGLDIDDTILLSYLIDERPIGGEVKSAHGLKTLARVRYDVADYKFSWAEFYGLPEDQKPYEKLYKYLGQDVAFTMGLYYDFHKELRADAINYEGLMNVYRTLLIPGTWALVDIELRGFQMDVPYLKALRVEVEEYVASVKVELKNLLQKRLTEMPADQRPEKLKSDVQALAWVHNFNPNSPVQVKLAIYEIYGMVPEGEPKTDKATLQVIREQYDGMPEHTKFLTNIIDYREQSKALGTYVDGLLEASAFDGRVHPDFHLNGTATGRLSCSNPNLQNIPVLMGPKIRHAFRASDGMTLINADFSQLELRIVAILAQEDRMKQIFLNGGDFHKQVASTAFKIPYEEVTSANRRLAKSITFGLLYGRGAAGLATGWEFREEHMTLDVAQGYIDQFMDGFPQLKAWIEGQHKLVIREHEIRTKMGRVRRFPLITAEHRSGIQRQAQNTPVQSLASDMTLTAMIKVNKKVQALGGYIVSTVHDSLMVEVPHDKVEEAEKLLKETMQDVPIEQWVPILAEVSHGANWEEAK